MHLNLNRSGLFSSIMIIMILLILKQATCTDICPVANQESNEQQSLDTAIANEPCFDLQPFEYNSNKKAQQEKSVELECYIKNKGPYSVAWMHENQLISLDDKVIKPDRNIVLDTDSTRKFNLKISHVDPNHKGSYRCQISTMVAKNLEYTLDVLVPPSITRIPNNDIIVLSEGESITVQCLTQGNPKPKLTWSKRGEKAVHTTIDELKSTLNLQNVDESHSDTYSCTAKNGVGNPVSSEFQIFIKFKPRVKILEEENFNKSVMYSTVGRKEQIKCIVNSYPMPKMTLLHNNVPVVSDAYTFEESQPAERQYTLTYSFIGSTESFGEYRCVAENDIGSSESMITVTPLTSEITITNDKLPIYSDAALFEWSLLSGSPIQELHVQVFSSNNTNGTNLITKTKQILPDGTESLATYLNENLIQYKDFYDVTKLTPNTTYTIRIRVKNDYNEWSQWSQNLTVKTHSDDNEKLTKHRSNQMHHHRLHHDKKHKNYLSQSGSRDLNGKRFNTYLSDQKSSATKLNAISLTSLITCFYIILVNRFTSS